MTKDRSPRKDGSKHSSAKKKQTEFESLNLPEPVIEGIRKVGFENMTPIQKASLPLALEGKDLCGQAQTGTGKTAAFLIALFSKLHDKIDRDRVEPMALILAPTRELAIQIHREGQALGEFTGLRMLAVYGGEGYVRQERKLRAGVDIVVGTPGRLIDYTRRRVLNLNHIQFLVIDEADRLFDMGFWDELRDIFRFLPTAKNRQSMLFSATLDSRTKRIASASMNRPVDVVVNPETVTAEGIDQTVYHVGREEKFRLLLGIVQREEIPKGLIFANRKVVAEWIVKKLKQHGIDSSLLTGDLRQSTRTKVLDKFKDGQIPLLVASDVASRGLHIDDVTHIINFDVPQDPEDYVHRIGRTARAGKQGKAYTLACDEYCYSLPDIEKLLGQSLPYQVPYEEELAEDKTPEYTIGYMMREQSQSRRKRPFGRDQKNEKFGGRNRRGGSDKKTGPGKTGTKKRNGPPRSRKTR